MITNKLSKFFAIEIKNLDVRNIPSKETISEISEILAESSVVVIRNQNITDDDHIKFSEKFGALNPMTSLLQAFSNISFAILRFL